MTVSLRVAVDGTELPFFEKMFTKAEFGELNLGLDQNRRSCPVTVLYPRRTDTVRNFCNDLFFPIGMQELSEKVDGIATKIIRIIAAFCSDLYLLPVRILTAVPRFFYNLSHTKETDLFYKYLACQKGVTPETHLANSSVYVVTAETEGDRVKESARAFFFCNSTGPVSIWNKKSLSGYVDMAAKDFIPWKPLKF